MRWFQTMTNRRLGMVMDPIEKIKPWKDSSFAMMLEAQNRGWQIFYMRIDDLYMENSISYTTYQTLEVTDNNNDWFRVTGEGCCRLDSLDAIFMRKDPPFDLEYIFLQLIPEQSKHGICIKKQH